MPITGDGRKFAGLRSRRRGAGLCIPSALRPQIRFGQASQAAETVWGDWFFEAVASGSYTLTASPASFALTGASANTLRSRVMGADGATYAFTGASATLGKGVAMTASPVSYTLTGADAGLRVNRVIVAASGSFNDTLTDAGLLYGRRVTADTVSFALTGTDATLSKTSLNNYSMPADSGSFALTGADAVLTASSEPPIEPTTPVVRGGVRFKDAQAEWEARQDFRKQAVQIIERLDEAPQEAPVTVEAVAEVAPRFSLVEAISEGVELGLDIDPVLLALQARNAMLAEQNAMVLLAAIEQEREAIALAWFMAEAA